MALKVIGAGHPRTGTASLKVALEQLGFGPCHHMKEVLVNPPQAPMWIRALDGHPDWDAIFDGYQSCTDAPACLFWRELAACYPRAKVLLSVRDPEDWFESTQATVFSEAMRSMARGGPMEEFFAKLFGREFGDRIHDHDFMISEFERRRREVTAEIPPERLLVFDVRQGWEPLCAFLGAPVPDRPFPRVNTRDEMAQLRAAAGEDRGGIDFTKVQELVKDRFRSDA